MTCSTFRQFLSILYNPLDYVPPKASLAAVRQFIERVKTISGDVYLLRHGYLALLTGKRSFAHEMAVFDIENSGQDAETKRIPLQLKQPIDAAIENRKFAAIITDYDENGKLISNTAHIQEDADVVKCFESEE